MQNKQLTFTPAFEMLHPSPSFEYLESQAVDFFKLGSNEISLFSRSTSELRARNQPQTQLCPGSHKTTSTKCRHDRYNRTRYHKQGQMSVEYDSATLARKVGARDHLASKNQQDALARRHQASSSGEVLASEQARHQVSSIRNGKQETKQIIGTQKSSSPCLEPADHQAAACHVSSASSTSSLPSICSSPSVSPSLVCPHMSLDDILASARPVGLGVASPHTVGLCAKCRTDPPPNVHSPLSPVFRPSAGIQQQSVGTQQSGTRRAQQQARPSIAGRARTRSMSTLQSGRPQQRSSNQLAPGPKEPESMRRARSDHSATSFVKRARDDSLDYYLEPSELRRLQLSPTIRHSVGFMRKNSIESGRVVRVYKNGQPFDKPLRICIMRNEFATLNHFLDHVNGRQLIPSGARYLFHLDGQLVYSVNELKHGSIYIVSGTRTFDSRANNLLRQQQMRDVAHKDQQKHHQHVASDRRENRVVTRETRTRGSNELVAGDVSQHALAKKPILRGSTRIGQSGNGSSLDARQAQINHDSVSSEISEDPAGAVELISKSSENLVDFEHQKSESSSQGSRKLAGKMSRAKSELGELPRKRKKNVTFVDTNRGSSPAINGSGSESTKLDKPKGRIAKDNDGGESANLGRILARRQPNQSTATDASGREAELESLGTNEIGIQVSDSIDGFLIDLPMAMPARNDDSNLQANRAAKQRFRPRQSNQPEGSSQNARSSIQNKPDSTHSSQTQANAAGQIRDRRIVTIIERQLSSDEMSQLKDLDGGDHHNESSKQACKSIPQVTIDLDSSKPISSDDDEAKKEAEIVAPSDKIVSDDIKQQVPKSGANPAEVVDVTISTKPNTARHNVESKTKRVRVVSTSSTNNHKPPRPRQQQRPSKGAAPQEQWQYPGGRTASATPTERPISQSGPNETVCARVSTPTPSISTTGTVDNLAGIDGAPRDPVVCETSDGTMHEEDKLIAPESSQPRPKVVLPPVKQRVEVKGKPVMGLDMPKRNFKLLWVNGFTMNDQYPDNCVSSQHTTRGSGATSPVELASGIGIELDRGLHAISSPSLSDSANQLAPKLAGSGQVQFVPSDRFNNWVCYSPSYGELIYPAGALVVLWCRRTDEQRFYANHTASVSALALASQNVDLVASAQLPDPSERALGASVHLWSLASLTTLRVLDDNLFRGKRIISLRLRHTHSTGCELAISARDDKQVWLFAIECQLQGQATESGGREAGTVEARSNANKAPVSTDSSPKTARPSTDSRSTLVLKASKLIQANQMPMLVLPMPSLGESSSLVAPGKQSTSVASHKFILSFGRRHFNLWLVDVKQVKLRQMQVDNTKNSKLTELLAKANCLIRLSPNELLLGDSGGNIHLLVIKQQFAKTDTKMSSSNPSDQLKYQVDTINLSDTLVRPDNMTAQSITCLSRISGNLFCSADSACVIRLWRIQRPRGQDGSVNKRPLNDVTYKQMSCINLPPDLGLICTIVLASYERKSGLVEIYVICASNSILFCSIKLQQDSTVTRADGELSTNGNSTISIVYEGHETSASSLVADLQLLGHDNRRLEDLVTDSCCYFTCSLDCRICKWSGKQLLWKSLLPSPCASIAIHPEGRVLAVGSTDGTVYIIDKLSGLLVSYFPLTPVRINCLAYSRDGVLLAAGCSNGNIFILPVYDQGFKYRKVSIFQSPHAVVCLQFSTNNRYMLTSVTHGSYQELILWDLPNFRYMRDNVKLTADRIQWHDSICTGSEDVRAIWENSNLTNDLIGQDDIESKRQRKISPLKQRQDNLTRSVTIVNLSCHRLVHPINNEQDLDEISDDEDNFVIASDTVGYLRLFRYPSYDIQQGFHAIRISSTAVNCCRFINLKKDANFVSTSIDGSICLWKLE